MVLLTVEATKLSKPFEAFLSFALANTQDTVRFVHVYSNRQQGFASTLLPDSDTFQGKSAVSRGFPPGPKLFTSMWHLIPCSSFEYILGSPEISEACFVYLFLSAWKPFDLFFGPGLWHVGS